MALVQIGVKVEDTIKDRVRSIVKTGRFRDMSDFCAEAIREKLEREDLGIQSIDEMRELIERSQKIEAVIENHEARFKEIEAWLNKTG